MSDSSDLLIKQRSSKPATGGHPGATVLWPVGIVHGPTGEALVEADLAGWLAGGPSAFTAVELIEGGGTVCDRGVRSIRQAKLIRTPAVVERLRLLTVARPPIAGLTWVRPRILSNLNIATGRGETGELSTRAAVQQGQLLAASGADIVALSAAGIELDEAGEVGRIEPIVAKLAARGIRVAVASSRPLVMRAAARAGARLLIDNTPGIDEEQLYTLADLNLPVILRRSGATRAAQRGSRSAVEMASTMNAALEERIEVFEGAGIPRQRLIIDPGMGGGLSTEETLAILHALALFHGLGCVLFADCVGIGGAVGSTSASGGRRLDGSDVAFAALMQGAQIISVNETARAWAAASAFRALAAAQFKESE